MTASSMQSWLISQDVLPTTSPATLLLLMGHMGEAVAPAPDLHQVCSRQMFSFTEEVRKGLPVLVQPV